MGNIIIDVKVKKRGSLVRVEGITRTERGTRIISRTVPIQTKGKSKEEVNKEIGVAVESFYPSA